MRFKISYDSDYSKIAPAQLKCFILSTKDQKRLKTSGCPIHLFLFLNKITYQMKCLGTFKNSNKVLIGELFNLHNL